jgi:hypothetical protein
LSRGYSVLHFEQVLVPPPAKVCERVEELLMIDRAAWIRFTIFHVLEILYYTTNYWGILEVFVHSVTIELLNVFNEIM